MGRFRWDRTWMIAVIYALHVAAWGGESLPQMAYAEAISKVGPYCVNSICLGMTLKQVKAMGTLQLAKATPSLSGTVQCSDFNVQTAATVLKPDGSRIVITFDVVEAKGSPDSRYRVSSLNKFIPGINQVQLDYLTQSLLKRFGGMKQMGDAASWYRRDGDISVSVLAGGVGTPDLGPFIWIMSRYERRNEWLMSIDACRANLPKL